MKPTRTYNTVYFGIEYSNDLEYVVTLENTKDGVIFFLRFVIKTNETEEIIFNYIVDEKEGNEILSSFYEDENNFTTFLVKYILPLYVFSQ